MTNLPSYRRLALICCTLSLAAMGPSPARGEDREKPFWVEQVKEENRVTAVAHNTSPGDVTVTIRCESSNMDCSQPLPLTTTVAARSERPLYVLTARDEQEGWRCQSSYQWQWGRHDAKHDDSCLYTVPFDCDRPVPVSQGYGGSYSHQGRDRYCLDFRVPEGTPVCAARGGIVVDTVSHFSEGGRSRSYIDKGNRVLILHKDGTIARYAHFMKDGVDVRVGDRVRAGQRIGRSGNTGWSTEPHLHFNVERPVDGSDYVRLPTRFHALEGDAIELRQGLSYTRPSLSLLAGQFAHSLAALEQQLNGVENGGTWVTYLDLAALRSLAVQDPASLSSPNVSVLQEAIGRFRATAANRAYDVISQLDGFRAAHAAGRLYLNFLD